MISSLTSSQNFHHFPQYTSFDALEKKLSQTQNSNPDSQVAESYIPAALLTLKVCFYTSMVSMLINLPIYFAPIIFSTFILFLYMDHIYLFVPFLVDTTLISSDIVFSNVFMIVFGSLENGSGCAWCSFILVLWMSLTIFNLLSFFHLRQEVEKRILHAVFFFFFSSFVIMKTFSLYRSFPYDFNNTVFMNTNSTSKCIEAGHFFFYDIQGIHFFMRSLLYVILILVDAYTSILHQETGRLYICKYGPLLFSQWQLSILFFVILLTVQIFKINQQSLLHLKPDVVEHSSKNATGSSMRMFSTTAETAIALDVQNEVTKSFYIPSCPKPLLKEKEEEEGEVYNGISTSTMTTINAIGINNSNSNNTNIADLNVMEAFRMAKEQYCKKNIFPSHHGGKLN